MVRLSIAGWGLVGGGERLHGRAAHGQPPCVPRRSRSRAASCAAFRSCANARSATVTAWRAVCVSSSSCEAAHGQRP